jgi:hypothetical protein
VLLERGATLSADPSHPGSSTLTQVVRRQNLETAKVIIHHDYEHLGSQQLDSKLISDYLRIAVDSGESEMFSLLLEKCIDVNTLSFSDRYGSVL